MTFLLLGNEEIIKIGVKLTKPASIQHQGNFSMSRVLTLYRNEKGGSVTKEGINNMAVPQVSSLQEYK